MKKILFAIPFLFSVTFLQAQPPAGDANPGDVYGASPVFDKVIPVDELPALLEKQPLENITIKGKVTDVCSKKGCWVTLETTDKTKIMVKMKDYAFFVPTAAIGKMVVMTGDAKIKTSSVAEQKHYAEDAKKTQAEIDAITEPKNEIRFTASGITIATS
ncbi:MAG: DUF4920 domain-containing protein [Niastella sp. SCN 39-18]|nr:DUF4920 domain-containing protein [Sphingobacteriales bacterium]ODT52649.1 MAG: DUF4920 domain-containing protein [Niastella sp. SCN 39-18]OJW11789.1 MAG: DUF4920 domain-containing protein [Sphingobacteriales bacterium 39-19]